MLSLPELIQECRRRGVKITPQRRAIFECLQSRRDHPTAEEIFRQVRRGHPSLSFATVYNTLQLLQEMGQVREIIVDELRRRYDVNTRAHHHAICRRCRRIQDVPLPEDAIELEAVARRGPDGFRVEAVTLEWSGLCGACAARE